MQLRLTFFGVLSVHVCYTMLYMMHGVMFAVFNSF